jgi:flagellar motor component MotA
MFAIIGIIIVFWAVLGGHLMEHGNVRVLIQPAELLIIAGAAVGTILIANPLHILKQIGASIQRVKIYQAALPRFPDVVLRHVEVEGGTGKSDPANAQL